MDTDKIRQILNALVIIGVVVTIICYYTLDDKTPFFYAFVATAFCNLMEVFIRFTQ